MQRGDLHNTNHEQHHTDPFEEIQYDTMESVREPTAVPPHLRGGIAHLTDVDE